MRYNKRERNNTSKLPESSGKGITLRFPISWMAPVEAAELALLRVMYNAGHEEALPTAYIVKKAIERFPNLQTPTEQSRETPSGHPWWPGRFRFLLTALKCKGEAVNVKRGFWGITDKGRERIGYTSRTQTDWEKCEVRCPTCNRETLKLVGPFSECPRCFAKRRDILIEETKCVKCKERAAKVTTLSQGLLDIKVICPRCGTYPLESAA